MGVPPEMSVYFQGVDDAAAALPALQHDERPGIVLVGDVDTMCRLVSHANGSIKTVNVGGVHHSPGRTPRLRYVFLTPAEEEGLRQIAKLGAEVTAQDVPGTKPVPLEELLHSTLDH